MRHTRVSSQAAAALLVAMFVVFRSQPAYALFDNQALDPAFCKTQAVRQTVVYVDDLLMIDGRTAWVGDLIRKLRASLAPGEKTTVVELNPVTGTSTEVWTGCWADYTPEQRASIEKSRPYLFTRDPLDALADQQKSFARDLNAAVSKIYFKSKRPVGDPVTDGEKMPQKQLLRALASDEGRFTNSGVTVRAIVYSDMAENSDLGRAFKPVRPDEWVNYAEKLGTHLRKSVFYVFGAGESSSGTPAVMENTKAFWSQALRSMSANLGGFGSQLNVPNGVPVASWFFDTTLKEGDQELDGKLSILTDTDGEVVDSWMGFSRLNIAGVTGTFRCDGTACKLNASTTAGLATDRPSETLLLNGTRDHMTGTLGVSGTKALFPLAAALVRR